MFRFVRWLFLMAIIATLVGFLLTYRLQGQTSAERVCRLNRSAECVRVAAQWGEKARRIEGRVRALLDPPAPSTTPHAVQHPTPPAMTVMAPPRDAPPLDRHTPQERQALGKILAQRGSR